MPHNTAFAVAKSANFTSEAPLNDSLQKSYVCQLLQCFFLAASLLFEPLLLAMAVAVARYISNRTPSWAPGIPRSLKNKQSNSIQEYILDTETDAVFFDAVAAEDEDRVRQLIADGFDLNPKIRYKLDETSSDSFSIIQLAVKRHCDGIAALLIQSGTNIPIGWAYTDLVNTAFDSKSLSVTANLLLSLAKKDKVAI